MIVFCSGILRNYGVSTGETSVFVDEIVRRIAGCADWRIWMWTFTESGPREHQLRSKLLVETPPPELGETPVRFQRT